MKTQKRKTSIVINAPRFFMICFMKDGYSCGCLTILSNLSRYGTVLLNYYYFRAGNSIRSYLPVFSLDFDSVPVPFPFLFWKENLFLDVGVLEQSEMSVILCVFHS